MPAAANVAIAPSVYFDLHARRAVRKKKKNSSRGADGTGPFDGLSLCGAQY